MAAAGGPRSRRVRKAAPEARLIGSGAVGGLAAGVGETVEQASCNAGADEVGDIAAQSTNFFDETRRDELEAVRGHQKDGLDLRIEPGVHTSHLEFVFEIRNRTQPADNHSGTSR